MPRFPAAPPSYGDESWDTKTLLLRRVYPGTIMGEDGLLDDDTWFPGQCIAALQETPIKNGKHNVAR